MKKSLPAVTAAAILALTGLANVQAQDKNIMASGVAANAAATAAVTSRDAQASGAVSPATAAQSKAATAGAHKAGEIVLEPASLALAGMQKIDYELGTLYVPENRSDPASRIIGVGFVRVKAEEPTNAPPTFHLPGGPGSSYLTGLRNSLPRVKPYLAAGDVVLMDQRGFSTHGDVLRYGYKTPDEPLDEPGSLAGSTTAFLNLAREIVANYAKKGVDLRGYNVKEYAEDVNDLRKALGYKKISLVALSFGSQWSFATMRRHPEIVARAILSGVEPLNNGYDMPSGIMGSMHRYWNEARKDKALQPYMPPGELEAVLREIFKRFDGGPLKVKVKDPAGEQMVTVTLGREDLQRDLLHKAADGPAFVLSLYHQHYEAWAASVVTQRRSHQNDRRVIGPLIDTSLGVTLAREKQLRGDPGTEFLGQWNWDAYIASADIWPTADMGDDFRTPVKTSIPVIFVHGDWDTSTPMENSLEIVKSFPNGRVLIIEHGEHAGIEPLAQSAPKVFAQLLDFLRTGNMTNLPERVTVPAPKFVVPDFPPPGTQPTSKAAGKE